MERVSNIAPGARHKNRAVGPGDSGQRWMRRLHLACVALAISAGMSAAQDVPIEPNTVCGPKVSAGNFKVSEIGPQIAGLYVARAPGITVATGIQEFTVRIDYKNGRLYIGGDGKMIELRPVRGKRKLLRYDFIKGELLPKSAQATELSLGDIELVTDCSLYIAPQFEWSQGSGKISSWGVYSFLDRGTALGVMMQNSTGALREVVLFRQP